MQPQNDLQNPTQARAAPEGLRVVGAAAEGAVRLAGGAAGEAGVGTGSGAGVGTGSGAGAGSGAGGGRTFGFEEGVGFEEHRERVLDVFRRVAPQYDVMNDAMSFFLHRLWKDRLVEVVQPFPGQRHLDVAGGTGDVAFRMLEGIRAAEAAARAAAAWAKSEAVTLRATSRRARSDSSASGFGLT